MSGVVNQVHLGGQGTSTYFLIDSNDQVQKYSSYYGLVWPGMERVEKGDSLSILAERNKLKKGQFLTGKEYWIWELKKGNDIIVKYEDVLSMVTKNESNQNTYVNYFLYVAIVLFLIAYLKKRVKKTRQIATG